ncbi:hypothetical protein BMETH_140_4 [methanotrophic bacterial endosymbiont of Bathymodiolus sp.]|nr:hypothetical protein BMETH_140_4 [methanotrophic bacterial endosymbiont of Bathymodiolus sp.]
MIDTICVYCYALFIVKNDYEAYATLLYAACTGIE